MLNSPTAPDHKPAGTRTTGAPRLSVIVIVYDMAREAPRTLRSLAKGFQNGIAEDEYEVIVVDNGSPEPLGEKVVRETGLNFKYVYVENASVSPAPAVSLGVSIAAGQTIGILVDGARIATPGLLRTVLQAFQLHKEPVVATLGWHLGPLAQQRSIPLGYNKEVEDEMLGSVNWPESDYRLFQISAFAQSSKYGFFSIPAESNGIFVSRRLYEACGGCDARFTSSGGGFVNHDFFKRAVEYPGTQLIVPLAEGTFHQVHGGISTNASKRDLDVSLRVWNEEYKSIRGLPYETPKVTALYLGPVRAEQEKLLVHSLRSQFQSRTGRLLEVMIAWISIQYFTARCVVKRYAYRIIRGSFRVLPLTGRMRNRLRGFFDQCVRMVKRPR